VQADKPVSGRSIRLSLDLDLQQAGESAMSRAIAATPGVAGAFVALDPRDGKVLAMGSDPTFDPSVLARPITQARFDALFGEQAGSPLVDRAIAGQYPTGSTFKPVTALAGMAEGLRTPDTPIVDDACVKIGEQERCNARHQANGTVALRRALQVSSDVYFYTLGRDLNPIPGQPLQRWARKLGFDHPTGIDLPGEFGGTIPDRAWRDRRNRLEARCRRERHVPACGIADGTNRPWTLGDEVNLAVGQGDIQATPLQMAVAYSAIANGGRVLRPRLGAAIEDANGRLLQELPASPARRIKLDPRRAPGHHGRSAHGHHRRRDVRGRLLGLEPARLPRVREDGHGPDGQGRPVVVRLLRAQREPADRHRRHRGAGRVRRDAAAPVARYMLGEWFGQKKTFAASASDRNAE
jgi:penicillin-binding protein 2